MKGNIAVPLDLPALFKGYYKDEARTKAAHAGKYYITGDLDILMKMVISGLKDAVMISSSVLVTRLDLLK